MLERGNYFEKLYEELKEYSKDLYDDYQQVDRYSRF